jgi:hypothetical protein
VTNSKNIEIDSKISELESEAVRLLDSMFNIPDGFSSGVTNRIVECIISAAILRISAALNQDGQSVI